VIRLAVRVRRADAELALAELLELAPSGVEEVDVGDDEVEYAVYGTPGEIPTLPELRAAAGSALVRVSTTEIADDWSERWRAFHRPVLVVPPAGARVPALRVRPPWEPAAVPAPGDVPTEEIVIDPGQAFGTGAHATTRLCLELLLRLAADGLADGPLLDVGCGSGVLAIAAARLGWRPVVGLDHEGESVEATGDNAVVNRVALDARAFDLRRDPLPLPELGAEATLTANLLRPLLLDLARALPFAPRRLVVSGLLPPELDEVAGAFAARGLREVERRADGEWAAALLAR